MSDDYKISYSYQMDATPAAPQAQADDGLIAFTNCATIDLGNGSVLLLNRDNGKQITVAAEVVTALTYCTTFRTLQEHARALVASIPQLQGQLADVTSVLTMVNEAGLMLQAQDISSRLSPDAAPEQTPAPSRAFIITCDRPAAVERLLDSMLQSTNLGRHEELFLVDDSRDTGNSEKNRELVAKFNRSSPKNMRYVGAAAQCQFMEQLIDAQPGDEASIRFLIDRERRVQQKSYGLARTVCLLLSVGYRCIVLDDDVLCRTVLPPNQGGAVTFGGGSSRELACFGSEQALMQQALYGDTDPLAGHASYLGMNLAQVLDGLGADGLGQDSLHDVNATMLNTLQADSPILVTQCGSWGDPGVPGSNWFTHLEADSIQRVLAAPGGLSGAMQNRHYWLGRTRPNISKMAVMSQATGLDNSRLLPPYFPVFRGEDYLFASMLLQLHPTAAVLDYNWCVPHLPLEQRAGGNVNSVLAGRGGLGLCARYLANRVDYERGACAPTRLAQLALHLQELSELEPASLLATFREELAKERADELRRLTAKVQGAPALGDPDWEGFLRRSLEAVAGALQVPASPLDIPDAPQSESEEALLQQISMGIAEFGRALSAWPDMRNAATDISRQMLDRGELMP